MSSPEGQGHTSQVQEAGESLLEEGTPCYERTVGIGCRFAIQLPFTEGQSERNQATAGAGLQALDGALDDGLLGDLCQGLTHQISVFEGLF